MTIFIRVVDFQKKILFDFVDMTCGNKRLISYLVSFACVCVCVYVCVCVVCVCAYSAVKASS